MTTTNRENLWELMDTADIAVRVASHLRQSKTGRVSTDEECVNNAIEFLTQAEDGGRFLSTGQLHQEISSLRPLNWAFDTYQSIESQPLDEDYEKLSEYLERILNHLKSFQKSHSLDSSSVGETVRFFDALGEKLSSEIDQSVFKDRLEATA